MAYKFFQIAGAILLVVSLILAFGLHIWKTQRKGLIICDCYNNFIPASEDSSIKKRKYIETEFTAYFGQNSFEAVEVLYSDFVEVYYTPQQIEHNKQVCITNMKEAMRDYKTLAGDDCKISVDKDYRQIVIDEPLERDVTEQMQVQWKRMCETMSYLRYFETGQDELADIDQMGKDGRMISIIER